MSTTTTEDQVTREGQEGELFDPDPWQKPIPKLDGYVADKLVINISGSIELDRLLDDNLALIEDLALGRDVEWTIGLRVSGKGFTHSLKGEDETDVVGYQVK